MSDPGPIPSRWLRCPRKSEELIAGKFLALKTPLDQRYDSQVPPQFLFYPSMLFSAMKSYKVKIGLWIDLSNTSRFYDKRLVEEAQEGGCRYLKMKLRGHGETPSVEHVNTFIYECKKFIQSNPLEVIAVHCTHGFNRTGFLISSFLVQTEDWSPEAAVGAFAKARAPGIYKGDYLRELFRRYGDESDAPSEPPLPEWCFDEEEQDDDSGNASMLMQNNSSQNSSFSSQSSSSSSRSSRSDSPSGGGKRRGGRELFKKNPQFMEGVPGVSSVTEQPKLKQIQCRVQELCHWNKSGFPGAQPVSMDRDKIAYLSQKMYKVSWKADGARYMMLIDGRDQVYFIDRDNCVFQVENLTFPHRKNPDKHISATLLDGEMVIDEVGDQKFPRYLVYDIVRFEGEEVGQTNFSTRLLCIDKELVQTRARAMEEGKIDKKKEPFGIRAKQFWSLSETRTLLGPKFTKASLGHEPDGLVFQPSDEPYTPGRDDKILKWKPSSHNSVDFKLKVVRESRPGMLPENMGLLFVGGMTDPFAVMHKLKKEIRALDNKIIECTLDLNTKQWIFMRERTDKSYANGYNTAVGVLKSIQQPVTTDMLLEFIEHHQFRRPIAPPQPGGPSNHGMMPPPNKMPRVH